MNEFWEDKIKTFLHDPPDKALILFHVAHEGRRDEILEKISLKYDKKLDGADHIASAMQRLNIPVDYRMDRGGCSNHICFKGLNKPVFKHTLSSVEENFKEIKEFIATYGYEKALNKFGFDPGTVKEFFDENDWKSTYFSIWRFLPEKYLLGYFLPADTRIPDHSIWDHLDVTAAISSCLGDLGLFALKMPAVQEFISQSRKLSDLWASSYIFSQLIFEGIKVIIEEIGPDAVIYPHLRGNSLFDISYTRAEPNQLEDQLRVANFPNTFLCFIPSKKAEEIEKRCKDKIKKKWKKIAGHLKHVKKIIKDTTNIEIDETLWENQINTAISISAVWREVFNFDRYKDEKDDLPEDLKDRQKRWLNFIEEADKKSNYGHFYYLTYELLGTILAQKSRFWEAWEEEPITGKKCLMCGRRNAVIENGLEKGYRGWDGKKWEKIALHNQFKHLLKERERLCAVCLVKRIYPKRIFPRAFGDKLKIRPPEFESVVDIAARAFIEKVKSDEDIKELIKEDIALIYKHEWESKEKENVVGRYGRVKEKLEIFWETYGEPNKYYAILMMDGDRIGKVLSGEKLPNFGDFLHLAFKHKIKEEWNKGNDLINEKRILTPSHHIAISRAMKDFSVYKVPEIVNKYDGFLVYSGGDDILALFPTNRILPAAKELQDFFKKDFYEIEINGDKKKVMGLGKYASMSAGIVFAHYKHPLYDVIEKVREVEQKAKNVYKRNAFCFSFIKRSGGILTAGGKWDFVDDLVTIANSIVNEKISHGFIYDFMEDIKILKEEYMLKSEVKRLLKRRKTEKATNEEINDILGKVLCLIDKYKSSNLPVEDIGNALKILYDAYRGEER